MTSHRPPAHGHRTPPAGAREAAAGLDVNALVAVLAPALAELVEERAVPDDALLEARGAGLLLGVPASWVLTEARAGRIPHVRLGRYVRFDRDELRAWAASRARGPRARTGSGPVPIRREAA